MKSFSTALFLAVVCAPTMHAAEIIAEDSLLFYKEPMRKTDDQSPFGFAVEYGQNKAAGKSEYTARSGKASIGYDNGLDEFYLDVDANYLKTSNGLVDDKRHAYLGYDRYLGSRLWLFLLNDWESNKIAGLNYTQLSGAGIKVDLLRNSTLKWNVGVAYLKRAKQTQFTISSLDENGNALSEIKRTTEDDKVISARLKFTVTTEQTRFSLISLYQPSMTKNQDPMTGDLQNDYSWSSEASIAYNLSKKVYAKLSYDYRFESLRTAPGSPRTDEMTTVRLGYEF